MPQPLNSGYDCSDNAALSHSTIRPVSESVDYVPAQESVESRHSTVCAHNCVGTVRHSLDWPEYALVDFNCCCYDNCAGQCLDSDAYITTRPCYDPNCNIYICNDESCTAVDCSNEICTVDECFDEACTQNQCSDVPCFLADCIDRSDGCEVTHSEANFCPEGNCHGFMHLPLEPTSRIATMSQYNTSSRLLPSHQIHDIHRYHPIDNPTTGGRVYGDTKLFRNPLNGFWSADWGTVPNSAQFGLLRSSQFIDQPIWNVILGTFDTRDTRDTPIANDTLGHTAISTSPVASHRSPANSYDAQGLSFIWSDQPNDCVAHDMTKDYHTLNKTAPFPSPKEVANSPVSIPEPSPVDFTTRNSSLERLSVRMPSTGPVEESNDHEGQQLSPPEVSLPSTFTGHSTLPEKNHSGPCRVACEKLGGTGSSPIRSTEIDFSAQQQLGADSGLPNDYICKWVLNPDAPEPCWRICNSRFQSALELDKHLNEVHIKLKKKQTCNWLECVRRTPCHDFKHKAKLRRHVQGSHSRCMSTYLRPFAPKAERLTTIVLEFPCRFCSRAFVTVDQRCNHETTHTGARPHRCSICQHPSATMTQHKTHMRTHTKDKPYKCPYCSHTSGDLSNLSKHIKGRHAGRPKRPRRDGA